MNDILIPALSVFVFCTLFFFWRMMRWLGPRVWLFLLALPALALCFWYLIIQELHGLRPWAPIVAFSGNIWCALAVAFTVISLGLEIVRALARLYFKRDMLPPRRGVPICLLLLLLFAAWSAFEAQDIRAKYIAIQTDKLPAGVNNYRIVFVSDVHINEISGEKFIARLSRVIAAQNADLLLFGGDTLSLPDMRRRQKEASMLAKVMPTHGSLGVLGNHEAMNDHLNNAIPFLKRAWIHVMRGEALSAGSVYVVGVDDPRVAEAQGSAVHDPTLILSRIPHERFVILLKHRPDIQPDSIGSFDLQLSGHTHGGQIWPAKYFMEYFFGAPQGELVKIKGKNSESWYYCTTGAGFSALPLRFLTPPEVVVLDLIR